MQHVGRQEWLIPDMYYPELTASKNYVSHESICVLNTGDADADIFITLYFENSEPVSLRPVKCAARRTHHIRMDKQTDINGDPVPKGVPYAAYVVGQRAHRGAVLPRRYIRRPCFVHDDDRLCEITHEALLFRKAV